MLLSGELDVLDFGPLAQLLCKNMTSSTKPEVHNALHCRECMTEPQLQVTYTENVVKFDGVGLEICERTDKRTDRHADRNASRTYRKQGEVTKRRSPIKIVVC